jgi:kynurenine formamidase
MNIIATAKIIAASTRFLFFPAGIAFAPRRFPEPRRESASIGPVTLTDVLDLLQTCRWVDLTHAFEPGIPHYSAFPDEQRRVVTDFEPDGFLAHEYTHIGQWGTHCDPPVHFVRGGRALDELPVTEMVLELVVLDLRDAVAADPGLTIGPEHIHAHEAEHGRIPERAFVAARTGWSARWPDPAAMGNGGVSPGWGVPALELLVGERGITAIGHETTDTDPGALVTNGQVPAEDYILRADRWQIELLAALDDVPARGALVVATWPKPRGGSGFPARVFAIVEAA